jgi:hypothetical protein
MIPDRRNLITFRVFFLANFHSLSYSPIATERSGGCELLARSTGVSDGGVKT